MNTGIALIVDDEPAVRGYIATILEEDGLETRQASSGAEALSVVKELAGRLDLIVSDVVMPDGDGLWLVRSVAESYPKIPIILMSALPMPALDGGIEFLHKPFSTEVLLAVVRKARVKKPGSVGY